MDSTQRDRQKRRSSARERQRARRSKKMAAPLNRSKSANHGQADWSSSLRELAGRVLTQARYILGDVLWYLRHNPQILRWVGMFLIIVLVGYLITFSFSGKIFPNISAMGIGLGGKSVDEASATLQNAWNSEVEIGVYVDGELMRSVAPPILGLTLNADETASAARSAGLAGIPMGFTVEPVVDLDYLAAQSYLLDITDEINAPPVNAGYAWENGQVVGVEGQEGRLFDLTATLDALIENPESITSSRRLNLQTSILRPDVNDPTPFLGQVQQRVNNQLELIGYDPFTNNEVRWPISPEIYTRWLEASPVSLTLREDAFLPYVDQLNASLNNDGGNLRYIAADEAMAFLRDAIAQSQEEIYLRVRYRSTDYEVQTGDTAMAIARREGIPFFLLEEANSGRDLNVLSPGDSLQIPSRDVTMANPPIASKRIIVDLNAQHLVAFENGQQVFSWPISSGVPNAVTSPGVYQILNHDPLAEGSSSTLCDSAGLVCGTWEMNWFMGIYEVSPGLVNGFHGAVLLPNGNLLGGGTVGNPATFGCVMSVDENAQLLYDWAEVGTVVEIVSNEHLPMSDLGWSVWNAEL